MSRTLALWEGSCRRSHKFLSSAAVAASASVSHSVAAAAAAAALLLWNRLENVFVNTIVIWLDYLGDSESTCIWRGAWRWGWEWRSGDGDADEVASNWRLADHNECGPIYHWGSSRRRRSSGSKSNSNSNSRSSWGYSNFKSHHGSLALPFPLHVARCLLQAEALPSVWIETLVEARSGPSLIKVDCKFIEELAVRTQIGHKLPCWDLCRCSCCVLLGREITASNEQLKRLVPLSNHLSIYVSIVYLYSSIYLLAVAQIEISFVELSLSTWKQLPQVLNHSGSKVNPNLSVIPLIYTLIWLLS